MSVHRAASHAGSWYASDTGSLNRSLTQWLRNPINQTGFKTPAGTLRAVIAPHAGYSYSGPTAAFAYSHINPEDYDRVFILGPSHHYYLPGCALTKCHMYDTPLGQLTIDRKIIKELEATGQFEEMSIEADEDEHSIEMHLPYIAKVMESRAGRFTIVPILVGALSNAAEAAYGRLLAPYLADPRNLFVISSDFCHWGSRFSYTPYDSSHGEIYQYIDYLDHEGMKLIESIDVEGFANYLRTTKNTICGRHPIAVLLNAIQALQNDAESLKGHKVQFTRYDQSNQVKSRSDSSVSYASAIVTVSATST